MRLFLACLALMIAGCSPEQSRNIGKQPKATLDSVSKKTADAMQQGQGSERLKESDSK
jgi:PBP1b-binding outer membrane lipoprotein LpoB